MRAMPRTCPSMRFKRFAHELLMSSLMPAIYPYRVLVFNTFFEDPMAADRSRNAVPESDQQHGHPHGGGSAGEIREGVRDPVCGMTVDPHTARHRHDHAGRTYYFCSAGCLARFAADPAKYLAPAQSKQPEPVPEGTIYTCPMHPQIRQVGPGSCPICGMALEPELVSAETGPNPELADMSRRFWVGLIL